MSRHITSRRVATLNVATLDTKFMTLLGFPAMRKLQKSNLWDFYTLPNRSFFMLTVATPEPSPTRLASSNRNPRMLGLFLFIFCVIKFYFSKMLRHESLALPEWRIRTRARFTPTFSFILSKHFIMSFRCESGFSFGLAHNHLQIQCNSVGP